MADMAHRFFVSSKRTKLKISRPTARSLFLILSCAFLGCETSLALAQTVIPAEQNESPISNPPVATPDPSIGGDDGTIIPMVVPPLATTNPTDMPLAQPASNTVLQSFTTTTTQNITPHIRASMQAILQAGHVAKYVSSSLHSGNMKGKEIIPPSSIPLSEDFGLTVHTHLRMLQPAAGNGKSLGVMDVQANLKSLQKTRAQAVALPATYANTPFSLACVYQLVPQPAGQPAGCDPRYTSLAPGGGGGAIALIDAYDYPTAAQDLETFSKYYGLPSANFQTIYVGTTAPYTNGSKPATDSDWNVEAALDIEWAHAMAPNAKIFLIELQDTTISSLEYGVLAAQNLVSQNGGGEISMSLGVSEFSGEQSLDSLFASVPAHVVQLASSGDSASVSWPASSPYVIGVGGTTLNRDGYGRFTSETAWSESGGGLSSYELTPSFQNISAVTSVIGTARGTPDIAMLADPSTGVSVYVNGAWEIVGGTSLAAPLAAGVLNSAASKAGSFPSQSTVASTLYSLGVAQQNFRDITSGSCSSSAATGYDLCTGWGSMINYISASSINWCNDRTLPPVRAGLRISQSCSVNQH